MILKTDDNTRYSIIEGGGDDVILVSPDPFSDGIGRLKVNQEVTLPDSTRGAFVSGQSRRQNGRGLGQGGHIGRKQSWRFLTLALEWVFHQ